MTTRKLTPENAWKPRQRKCLGCLQQFTANHPGDYFHARCRKSDDSGMFSGAARVLTPARMAF